MLKLASLATFTTIHDRPIWFFWYEGSRFVKKFTLLIVFYPL